MSFSVDDLVASLGASHIGQEAMDLAALQAQLAATLFPARAAASHHHHHHHQPCTTPLARTPSGSISMGGVSLDVAMAMRTGANTNSRRGSCSAPHHARNEHTPAVAHHLHLNLNLHHYHHHHHHLPAFDDAFDEDERMVEELLLPPPTPAHNPAPPSPSFRHDLASPTSPLNTFTSSDPFYLSQLQASQQAFAPTPAAAQGFFAQNGRMAQGSGFALQTAF